MIVSLVNTIITANAKSRREIMPRYIDADKLIEGRVSNDPVVIAANAEPTANVAEVKHGEWISTGTGYTWCYYCSECGWKDGYPFNDRFNYCPHCGAKMGG